MMNNETKNISMNIGTFSQYLLGESLKNILIRLTVILSAIIVVWSGIMLALIIHTKYQRMKQMQKLSNSHHHHLHHHDSTSSLNRNRPHRNQHFDASNLSLSSTRCLALRQILSQLKDHCLFWPWIRRRRQNEHVPKESSATRRIKLRQENDPNTSTKVQFVVQSMSRPSKQLKKTFLRGETESSSGDESKHVHLIEKTVEKIEPKTKCLTSSQTRPSISIPIDAKNHPFEPNEKRLYELHQLNKKATLLFHPLTRRLSNIHSNAILPPVNNIQKDQRHRSSYMVSSARELTSRNDWKWTNSLLKDPLDPTDQSLTSSVRHIPLVMITDTSSSNTNIVELETYEDKHRLIGDIERRLSRELRASYRPRHST